MGRPAELLSNNRDNESFSAHRPDTVRSHAHLGTRVADYYSNRCSIA